MWAQALWQYTNARAVSLPTLCARFTSNQRNAHLLSRLRFHSSDNCAVRNDRVLGCDEDAISDADAVWELPHGLLDAFLVYQLQMKQRGVRYKMQECWGRCRLPQAYLQPGAICQRNRSIPLSSRVSLIPNTFYYTQAQSAMCLPAHSQIPMSALHADTLF